MNAYPPLPYLGGCPDSMVRSEGDSEFSDYRKNLITNKLFDISGKVGISRAMHAVGNEV